MEDAVHSMFKYAQGVAHLWDVHEIGLAKQERALQEKLDDSRHEHDYVNQVSCQRKWEWDIWSARIAQDGLTQWMMFLRNVNFSTMFMRMC